VPYLSGLEMIKKSVFGKEIFEYTGVIHVHTEHSFDGHGSLVNIVKNSRKSLMSILFVLQTTVLWK